MKLVQHYNDLTEINQLRYGNSNNREKDLVEIEKKIKTRICFTDVKAYSNCFKMMDDAGWKVAKVTLDWHDAHGGDDEVRLYYKIFPDNVSDLEDKRDRAPSTYTCHHSLAGSCSMGLWNKLDKEWIVNKLDRTTPERYLTLLRLNRKRTAEEKAKMAYYRYTLVFKSDVASYFANGWTPDEWPGYKKEQEFWNLPDSPKKNGFVYKPA